MFGNVLKFVSLLSGWKAEGKAVQLKNAEGPGANLLEKITGTILEIRQFPAQTSTAILIKSDTSLVINGKKKYYLLLVPRHRGYDSFALKFTSIVSYVFALENPVVDDMPPQEEMLAIADLQLVR